jgi:hypothetical protein
MGVTMPPKRPAPDEANGAPTKQPKTEHPEEFSNAVKKKLQSSSRTGQACDRCKVSWLLPRRSPCWEMLIDNLYRRSAKFDAMDSPEDARHACRIVQSAGPRIELLAGPHRGVTSRDSSNRIGTCKTESTNWNSD